VNSRRNFPVTVRLALIGAAIAGAAHFAEAHAAEPKVDPQPRGNAGAGAIWVSRDEIMAKPMSGPAWTAMKAQADASAGTPDLSNQDQNNNVYVMAKAIVYVRTGISSYRDEVVQNCMAAIDTELGGRTLALGRELAAYVIAAELVGLDADDDLVFRAWLRRTLTETLDGRTLQSTHEDRPNNWGTLAGGSRAAVAVYLQDQTEIARTAQVFKGWLGDRSSFAGFAYQFGGQGADTWMPDPSQPTPVNPIGATVQGHNVDGALPDDISRGGAFAWPPGHTGYAWEGLSGAVVQAEILARQGYDVWNWEDRAMLRATEYLMYLDNEFGGWWTDDDDEQFCPWVINRAYGTNYRSHNPARTGKIMAWTDFTHSGPSVVVPDNTRPASVTNLR
jgi:Alginate lyase